MGAHKYKFDITDKNIPIKKRAYEVLRVHKRPMDSKEIARLIGCYRSGVCDPLHKLVYPDFPNKPSLKVVKTIVCPESGRRVGLYALINKPSK